MQDQKDAHYKQLVALLDEFEKATRDEENGLTDSAEFYKVRNKMLNVLAKVAYPS
jgi:hypothetical protein